MSRSRLVSLAAVAMLLAGPGYAIVEVFVASAWTASTYGYVYDQIPDLGNPTCGPFQGRVVCSPLHGLMNVMFVAHGILFAFSLAPLGVRERASIYPLFLWQIVAGLALLWASRRQRTSRREPRSSTQTTRKEPT